MRRARTFNLNGRHYTITELAALPECRCGRGALEYRLLVCGWTVERAISEPTMSKSAAGRRARLSPFSWSPSGEALRSKTA